MAEGIYYKFQRSNKFNAKRTVYNEIYYQSKAEASYAYELDMLKKAGEIKDWKRQIKFPLVVNNVFIRNYIMDFQIIHNNGIIEYVEVKGFMDELSKDKINLFYALYVKGNDGVQLTVLKNGQKFNHKFKTIKK